MFINLSNAEDLKWLLKNQAPLGSAQSRVRLTAPGLRRRLLFPWGPLGAVEAAASCAHRSPVSSFLPGASWRPCGEGRAHGAPGEAQQHLEAARVSSLKAQWCPIFGGGPEPYGGVRAEARHACWALSAPGGGICIHSEETVFVSQEEEGTLLQIKSFSSQGF